MKRYCAQLTGNWNFVNGFDLLTATLAIYQGHKALKVAINQEFSVETFEDFAKTIGVGALELAIATYHANPFLFIGAVLQLTAAVQGVINDGAVIYFRRIHTGIRIEFSMNAIKIEESLKEVSIQNSMNSIKIETSIKKLKL